MQRLNALWKLASAASTVRDIAQQSKTYYFPVTNAITVYLRAENAHLSLTRWARRQVEVTITLNMPIGWRIATDQDEAGVYIVAKRRAVIGGLANAQFDLYVPHDAYLILHLDNGQLQINRINGTLQLAPENGESITTVNQ